ncbi:uncharacterized protein PHACADRAFT_260264 [Phanerochaete carnosa HHB-10118-sp]|uniref:Uncharacterized protein n=1 Tax=Phanerochaete carnosa (strain HHB-10118-sp) TaxID=650164 RepID=K5W490_PHACS|nr:uncharacterized protein PHACADRAFT_260264 [Phanerochaete carnosa HHB-10118-sp]EKM53769.1 hypothetical protein PHACADRAFT_260264 [Phanerochaete carnosa HHB-10118-sp]
MLARHAADAGQGIDDACLLAKLLGRPQETHRAVDAIQIYAAVQWTSFTICGITSGADQQALVLKKPIES